MTNYKTIMFAAGRRAALDLQMRAPEMTGTEVIAERENVPSWSPAKDYTKWPIGAPVADDGQIWLLLIPHNSAHYTGRPSGLRALWGLAHTTDPALATPWVAPYGTSGLYARGECCTYEAADGTTHIYKCLYDGNEFPPLMINVESRWEDLGEASV